MSHGNLFLGTATGKVGSVVLYQRGGVQIARAYQPTKRNPRTVAMAAYRAIFKTASCAYSQLSGICRFAWQGKSADEAHQRFMRANTAMLRARVQDALDAGGSAILESAVGNFNHYGDFVGLVNPWVVSDGSLPTLGVTFQHGGDFRLPAKWDPEDVDWDVFCDQFGLLPGDVVYFVSILAPVGDVTMARLITGRLVIPDDMGMFPFNESLEWQYTGEGSYNLPVVNALNDGVHWEFAKPADWQTLGGFALSTRRDPLGGLMCSSEVMAVDTTLSSMPFGLAVESFMRSEGSVASTWLDNG